MNNRIKSLALLVNLGIYGVAFPLSAAETATDDKNSAAEETMVVTAAEQNLQAPGVSTITADALTTLSHKSHEMGTAAANMMIQQLKGIPVTFLEVPWTLIPKGSTPDNLLDNL